jgi:hypothetical protein
MAAPHSSAVDDRARLDPALERRLERLGLADNPGAWAERYLECEQLVDPLSASARQKFAATSRFIGDLIAHRWVVTRRDAEVETWSRKAQCRMLGPVLERSHDPGICRGNLEYQTLARYLTAAGSGLRSRFGDAAPGPQNLRDAPGLRKTPLGFERRVAVHDFADLSDAALP